MNCVTHFSISFKTEYLRRFERAPRRGFNFDRGRGSGFMPRRPYNGREPVDARRDRGRGGRTFNQSRRGRDNVIEHSSNPLGR